MPREPMDVVAETIAARNLSADTARRLEAIYQREFGWDRLVYATPHWYVVGWVGDELVGRVGVLERVISVNGIPLHVGGITGVVTEPDYRMRGVSRKLVRCGLEFLLDEHQIPLAVLTCNRKVGPIYERLGWRTVHGPTVYAQPGGPRTCPGLTMVAESGSAAWPDGPIDMRGLPW